MDTDTIVASWGAGAPSCTSTPARSGGRSPAIFRSSRGGATSGTMESSSSCVATTCLPIRMVKRSPAHGESMGAGRATTPLSVLDRFREVVFRLIMWSSAVSRSRAGTGGGGDRHRIQQRQRRGASSGHHSQQQRSWGAGGYGTQQQLYPDTHRSEAVEDCIEFFKRSSAAAEQQGMRYGQWVVRGEEDGFIGAVSPNGMPPFPVL